MCIRDSPTGKVEIWSTICESYIGDTVTESYVLETPGTAAKVGEKTPYFAQVCSPDRDAYAGDIPDIDKFPHWFEPVSYTHLCGEGSARRRPSSASRQR